VTQTSSLRAHSDDVLWPPLHRSTIIVQPQRQQIYLYIYMSYAKELVACAHKPLLLGISTSGSSKFMVRFRSASPRSFQSRDANSPFFAQKKYLLVIDGAINCLLTVSTAESVIGYTFDLRLIACVALVFYLRFCLPACLLHASYLINCHWSID
jgi:hypothetical protein